MKKKERTKKNLEYWCVHPGILSTISLACFAKRRLLLAAFIKTTIDFTVLFCPTELTVFWIEFFDTRTPEEWDFFDAPDVGGLNLEFFEAVLGLFCLELPKRLHLLRGVAAMM